MKKSLILFMFFMLVSSRVYATTYAHKASKNGSDYQQNYGSFSSGQVNKIVTTLSSANSASMSADDITAYYDADNFNFLCPGYSMLNSVQSNYDSSTKDRTFSFGCIFLEDANNNLLMKTSCKTSFTPNDQASQKATAISSCDTKSAIQGIQSQKWNGSTANADRLYTSMCCTMQDQSAAVFSPVECTTISKQAGASFTASCDGDAVITKITSNFYENTQDRAYNFTCCKLAK